MGIDVGVKVGDGFQVTLGDGTNVEVAVIAGTGVLILVALGINVVDGVIVGSIRWLVQAGFERAIPIAKYNNIENRMVLIRVSSRIFC